MSLGNMCLKPNNIEAIVGYLRDKYCEKEEPQQLGCRHENEKELQK